MKYVGKSVHISTRIRHYFYCYRSWGKFASFFLSYPIYEFQLEIFLVPSSSIKPCTRLPWPKNRGNKLVVDLSNEVILEQYFLLDNSFNFNTVRVSLNNQRFDCKSLYMYNRDFTILYFCSVKQIDFIKILNINHTTFIKHLTNSTYYLGKYAFS
jgi:hypothetical protein